MKRIGIVKVVHQFRGTQLETELIKLFTSYAVNDCGWFDLYMGICDKFRPLKNGEETPEYYAYFETIEGVTKFKEFQEVTI